MGRASIHQWLFKTILSILSLFLTFISGQIFIGNDPFDLTLTRVVPLENKPHILGVSIQESHIHESSVNSINYANMPNSNEHIVISGGSEGAIGRQTPTFREVARFGSGATLIPQFVDVTGPSEENYNRFAMLIERQFISYYNGFLYVISNLAGARIRVNRLSDYGPGDTGDFTQISNMKYRENRVGKYKITLCEETKWIIIIQNMRIFRIDYTKEDQTGESVPSASGNSDGREISFLDKPLVVEYLRYKSFGDSEKYIAVSFPQNIVSIIKLYNFGDEVSQGVFPTSIKIVKSLQGMHHFEKSEADNQQYQKECAFISYQWYVYIRDCLNPSQTRRAYTKIHGFYSINSFQVIPNTHYVYTGSQNEVAVWDVTSTAPTPPREIFISLSTSVLDSTILPPKAFSNNKFVRLAISLSLPPYYIDSPSSSPNSIPGIMAKNLCLVEGCVQCATASTLCQVCWPGFLKTGDGENCIDCGRDTSDLANRVCAKVRRPFSLIQTSNPLGIGRISGAEGEFVDLAKSGTILRIVVAEFEPWQWRLRVGSSGNGELDGGSMRNNIYNTFGFEIEGVNSKNYNSSYVVFDEQMFLAINYTTDFNNKKLKFTLRDTVLAPPYYGPVGLATNIDNEGNPIRRTDILILLNNTITLEVSGRETIDQELLTGLGTAGKVAGTVLTTVAVLTGGLAAFSVCTPFGMGSFILSFFQVIEIVSRLSLINVKFGLIILAILEGLDEAMGLPSIPENFFFGNKKAEVLTQMNPQTRGKLDYYEVSPISLSTIPILSFLYLSTWLIYIIYQRKVQTAKEIKSKHIITMFKIMNLRFLFYGMAILEFALFSAHEIVHHKALFSYTDFLATKTRILLSGSSSPFWNGSISSGLGEGVTQNGLKKFSLSGLFSYSISVVVLVLCIIETIRICVFAKRIYYADDLDFKNIVDALGMNTELFALNLDGSREEFTLEHGIEHSVLKVLGLVVGSRTNSGSNSSSSGGEDDKKSYRGSLPSPTRRKIGLEGVQRYKSKKRNTVNPISSQQMAVDNSSVLLRKKLRKRGKRRVKLEAFESEHAEDFEEEKYNEDSSSVQNSKKNQERRSAIRRRRKKISKIGTEQRKDTLRQTNLTIGQNIGKQNIFIDEDEESRKTEQIKILKKMQQEGVIKGVEQMSISGKNEKAGKNQKKESYPGIDLPSGSNSGNNTSKEVSKSGDSIENIIKKNSKIPRKRLSQRKKRARNKTSANISMSSLNPILQNSRLNLQSGNGSLDHQGQGRKRVTFGGVTDSSSGSDSTGLDLIKNKLTSRRPQKSNLKNTNFIKNIDEDPESSIQSRGSKSKSKLSTDSSKLSQYSSESNWSEKSFDKVMMALKFRKVNVYYPFIVEGLNEGSLYDITGLLMNVLFLIRLILLSLCMVVLQMLPLLQVLLMNFINIFYLVWVFNGIKKRVFESTWDMVHKIVLESAIQVFLISCVFFWLNRNNDFLSTASSIILQMLCVGAVLISILYELVTLLIGLYGSMRDAWRNRAMMRRKIQLALARATMNKRLSFGVDQMNERSQRLQTIRLRGRSHLQ